MGILSFTTTLVGQTGNFIGGNVPRRVSIVSSDNLATVTAAGYLNNIIKESGNSIYPTDIIDMWYGYVSTNSPGTLDEFVPSISNGVITLVPHVSSGNVLLPVVSGNFPVFNGTTGQIKDSKLAPSSTSASEKFVSVNAGSLTVGNFPQLSDANGTLNTGLPPTAAAQAFVVVSPGALTSGNLLKSSDANGTIADSGIVPANVMLLNAANTLTGAGAISLVKGTGTEAANAVTVNNQAGVITTSSLTTAGGASYAITWTNSFISATSVILLTLMGGTNTTENITLKATAGSGTSTLTIYNNTAATALNGTIIIGFAIF